MFAFLRAIDLRPIEWEEMVQMTSKPAPFVGEVLAAGFRNAQAVVVLLTGDDVARLGKSHLKEHDKAEERELTPQARANVLFEAGIAFGTHPDQTILVELGPLRPFSDTLGRHVVRMSDTPEARHILAGRLRTAGCAVRNEGTVEWLKTGLFEAAITPPDGANEVPEAHDADADFFLALRKNMQERQNNTYVPLLGSAEEKQAERLVARGYLKKGPMGGYMIANYL
jgi:hypothetical protein